MSHLSRLSSYWNFLSSWSTVKSSFCEEIRFFIPNRMKSVSLSKHCGGVGVDPPQGLAGSAMNIFAWFCNLTGELGGFWVSSCPNRFLSVTRWREYLSSGENRAGCADSARRERARHL